MRLFRHKLQASIVKGFMGCHRMHDSSIHFVARVRSWFLKAKACETSKFRWKCAGNKRDPPLLNFVESIFSSVLLYFLNTSLLITVFCQTGKLYCTEKELSFSESSCQGRTVSWQVKPWVLFLSFLKLLLFFF